MRSGPRPVRPERGECGALFCMQIHARYACTALYKAAGQKKDLRKAKQRHKKAAGRQRLCGIYGPSGMQNHNGPASDALLPVPVGLAVLFPVAPVR